MKSVLFLIPTLDRGGAENVLVDLVNRLDQGKFKITVQTLFDENSQKERLAEGIEYKSFLYHQFHGNSRLMAHIPARLLYKIIVKKKYDIIVSYLEGPTTRIIYGCPYSDTRTVAWIHSALDTGRGFSAGFAAKSTAISAYKSFDKVVFVANTVRQKIENTAETIFSNSIVLYNAIDMKEISARSEESIPEGTFNENEICIISTGKIAPVKGYDRLAHVQKMLVEEGYKTHVYILGEGKDRKSIEEYTIENGLSETFTFLGFQNNPYKYVAKADLFVCSSRREGYSTAVSEALVLGVPVITTEVSGMRELLRDNEYGVITDNNEKSLYQGIKHLLDHPELLAHYREMSAERGKAFDTENAVKAVEDMLLGLYES